MTTRKTATPRKRATTTPKTKAATAAATQEKKPVSGALDGALEAAKALSVGRRGAAVTNPEMEAVDASSQETIDTDVSDEDFASLRKKEFIEAVAQRSGVKRRDAKTAAEAALAELGEAIAAGRQINLPGFGKLKVNRSKRLSNGEVFVIKMRQPKKNIEDKAETTPKDPLAEAAE